MATGIQITIDCGDCGREAAFWAEALGYTREAPEDESDWDALHDPDGKGPRIYLQRVPEPKVAKNRIHLDLNVAGGPQVPLEERKRRVLAEVERLKALGASDHRGALEMDGEFWVRMNDPEGNEFCIQ